MPLDLALITTFETSHLQTVVTVQSGLAARCYTIPHQCRVYMSHVIPGGELLVWIRVVVSERTVRPAKVERHAETGESCIKSTFGFGASAGLSLVWNPWQMRKSEGLKGGCKGEQPSGMPDKKNRGLGGAETASTARCDYG